MELLKLGTPPPKLPPCLNCEGRLTISASATQLRTRMSDFAQVCEAACAYPLIEYEASRAKYTPGGNVRLLLVSTDTDVPSP